MRGISNRLVSFRGFRPDEKLKNTLHQRPFKWKEMGISSIYIRFNGLNDEVDVLVSRQQIYFRRFSVKDRILSVSLSSPHTHPVCIKQTACLS
jgi:hypothetical protein